MGSHNSYEYGRREFHLRHEDEGMAAATLLVLMALAACFYLLATRFFLHPLQLAEVALDLCCLIAAFVACTWYLRTCHGRIAGAWPHPPIFVPRLRDDRYVRSALDQGAVVAGYDNYGRPWLFSDRRRSMQTLLLGQSGSGKTTLLLNLASQDLRRRVGGRPVPLIVFDGKGDQQFLRDFLFEAYAAGRNHDLRVIDPFQPEISARFNPFFGAATGASERVSAFFDSFALRHDFFRAHQATYLSDVCRILDHCGAVYTIPDVVVMARDETIMRDQIAKARQKVECDLKLSVQRRQNFEMSARNLLQSFSDRERVPKIQGLLNELMTFAQDDLARITNTCDDLFTFEELVERRLVLFVSLNANKNGKAVTALGRMLLQALQLMVGERYRASIGRKDSPLPMVSVILDEFGPFAHPSFAQLLQTARGSNVALIFSLQSIPQLRAVSRSFADEVSSAPNTLMLLRTRDEESVRFFLDASAKVTGERRTMTVEREGVLTPTYREIGFGSVTEIEKTRAVDFELKNLPAGQMQVLTTDERLGTLHLHLHVRRTAGVRLSAFTPRLYPHTGGAGTPAANLRFRDLGVSTRTGRIFRRTALGRL